MIPYGKQSIDQEDIDSIVEVLKSDFLTTGPKVQEFETKFASYVGSKYAVAVSNGTAALHLACLAAGLSPEDKLITTPMTFAASANCALYCGSNPVFADIEVETGCIDPNEIRKKITTYTKILIPVHYGGHPCNLEEVGSIARQNKLIVIEDASHALGSRYKDTKIGDCTYSEMTIFSFHPVKNITTGEGGMITTNSKELYEKLIRLRTHGITKDESTYVNKSDGPWYHEMQVLGYNYRITDIQCALGKAQLNKIEDFIERRQEIARKYREAFEEIPEIECLIDYDINKNAYHLFVIKTKNRDERLKLFTYLKENDIFCQVHYIPVYWHPYYQKIGYKRGLCPKAESFYEHIISIPIYPLLTEDEQDFVIKKIGEFYESR